MKTLLTSLLLVGCYLLQAQDLRQVYNEAITAYGAKDFAAYLDGMRLADSLRPNHPTILYNLSSALALNGLGDEAVQELEQAVWLNANNGFEEDEDFASLHEREDYQAILALAAENRREIRNSEQAFSIDDRSLHPEGVAYDHNSGAFYLSSVRQRKIIKVMPDGELITFNDVPGLWAMMGLTVDHPRNLLWACSVPAPEMIGFAEDMANRSALLAFDLETGELLHRYEFTADNAWLGDLILTNDGTIYTSSSSAAHPAIYRLTDLEGELEEYRAFPELLSLQGLCLDQEEEHLFFSDYRYGLFKIRLETNELLRLTNTTPHPLKGIDGLYYFHGHLVAIHNGLPPFQVTAYRLNEAEEVITEYIYLDKALPEMGEPTLGVLFEHDLYYLANSPWGAYDREKVYHEDQAAAPIVMKLPLQQLLKQED